jgi:tetratricopeptide (TPR) repeat protein
MSLYDIGENHYIKGKYKEALKYFQESYKRGEEKIDALNYMGCCYMNLGEYQMALELFDSILRSHLWERALFNKGRVYLRLENYEEALAQFNRAKMVNPNNDEVYYYLGVYYDKIKDYHTSKAYYENAIDINDKEPEYHLDLGNACYRIGEIEKAVLEFDMCISLNDPYTKIDALYNKGCVYYRQKKYEDALHLFLRAIDLSPSDTGIMNMIANAFYKLREYEKSMLWLDKVLSIDANDKEALAHKKFLLKVLNKESVLD